MLARNTMHLVSHRLQLGLPCTFYPPVSLCLFHTTHRRQGQVLSCPCRRCEIGITVTVTRGWLERICRTKGVVKLQEWHRCKRRAWLQMPTGDELVR